MVWLEKRIVPWTSQIEEARKEMEDFTDDFMSGFGVFNKSVEKTWTTSEIKDNKLFVYVSAAGHTKEDFKVSFDKGVLSIFAEQNRNFPLSDTVSVSRALPEVDETKLEAVYENGILTVSAPLLKKEKKTKQVVVR